MKAAVYYETGPPDVFRYEDVPEPSVPRAACWSKWRLKDLGLPDRVHPMVARHIADAGRGALRIVVDRSYPLSEAAEAHRYIESRRAFGRVLLVP